MSNPTFTLKSTLLCALILTCAGLTLAQQRTFVSSTGNDANDCLRATPCRNFQRGHDAVMAGGEVVALDAAGYGPLVINKSVTITGEGFRAAVATAAGNAVTINAPGITVVLRHLHIQRTGAAGDVGISAVEFSALHIEGCTVNGFAFGIFFLPEAQGGTPAREMFIEDTILRNNTEQGLGLNNSVNTGTFSATIERTRVENNGIYGVYVRHATVTVRECLASGNGFYGFDVATGELNIESSVSSNNGGDGISVGTGGTVRVSNSTVTNNTGAGFKRTGTGVFETRGNNTVKGNAGGDVVGGTTSDPGT